MPAAEQYDVIIVGGGPAGLGIAVELAARCSVLLLEKGVAGETDRFWFVPPDVLDEDTEQYAYGGVTRFLTKTYSMQGDDLVWAAQLFPRYPYIKDRPLLAHWAETARSRGALVLDRTTYRAHQVDAAGVTVTAERDGAEEIFSGRLLIDASGYDSPIVKQYDIDRSDFYWWSVFGAVGEHPDGLGDMEVGDYMMWQTFESADKGSLNKGTPVFEYEILDQTTSFSLILYLRQQQMTREEMRAEYYRIIRQEESAAGFRNLNVANERWGWYPSGGLSQQIAFERVAFAGDAACWTTPCGWGMTFILDNYRSFAHTIADCLDNDALDRDSLLNASHYRLHDKFEIITNVLATHFLANASTAELDKFIRLFMGDIPPVLCEKVFTLKVSQEELLQMIGAVRERFSLLDLCRLIPAMGLTNIYNEITYFAGDALADFIRELFHAHPDTESGFDFEPEALTDAVP